MFKFKISVWFLQDKEQLCMYRNSHIHSDSHIIHFLNKYFQAESCSGEDAWLKCGKLFANILSVELTSGTVTC